jgi:protein-S-isoprenylcysteine O-methyltransferase Ste14
MELVQQYIKEFTPTRALRWGAALSLCYTAYLSGTNPNPGEKSTDKTSANDRAFRLMIRGDGLLNKLLTVGVHAGEAIYHLSHYADEAFSHVEIAVWAGAMAFLHFRLWAMRTLGEYFTFQVMIREDHKLIAHGPYKYLMHPSYTGTLLLILLIDYLFFVNYCSLCYFVIV